MPESNDKIYCSGILGSIQLVTGFYLILITNKQKVGTLLQNEVWKMQETKMIAYREAAEKELTESEVNYFLTLFTLQCVEMNVFLFLKKQSKNLIRNAKQ